MDLSKKTATELKEIAKNAMATGDRNLVAEIKAEVLARAAVKIGDGTATESLCRSAIKLAQS